jgi:hypothetical protein
MRGPKRKLIQERYTDVADGMGGFTRTWNPLRNLTGTFYTVGGDEAVQYAKIGEVASHKFITKIKSGESIKTTDRFRDPESDAIYEIKFIDDSIYRAHWWTIRLKQYDVVTP